MSSVSAEVHPADPIALGSVLDHLYENREEADLVKALSKLTVHTPMQNKLVCDELAKVGLVGYDQTELRLTPAGIAVVERRQRSPIAIKLRPTVKTAGKAVGPRWHLALRWILARLTPSRRNANCIDWFIVIVLWGLILAAVAVLAKGTHKFEHLLAFQIGAQACILIGTLYIASGVIYHRPAVEFATLHELQEHFSQVLWDASRHCKIGLCFFMSGTIIEIADKSKYLGVLLQ